MTKSIKPCQQQRPPPLIQPTLDIRDIPNIPVLIEFLDVTDTSLDVGGGVLRDVMEVLEGDCKVHQLHHVQAFHIHVGLTKAQEVCHALFGDGTPFDFTGFKVLNFFKLLWSKCFKGYTMTAVVVEILKPPFRQWRPTDAGLGKILLLFPPVFFLLVDGVHCSHCKCFMMWNPG